MAADASDKITDTRNATRPVSTTVASPRSGGGTTLTCGSLTGWPTGSASKIHGVTYQIDSNSNPVAGTQLDFSGIVSGSSITQFTVIDGTDTGNAIGDVVEMLPTAAWGQDLADALTNQHTRTGAHKNIINTGGMITDTLTVSSGTTLPVGDIGTADIADSAVTPAKLLAGTGTSWPWQSWVPVYFNITLGNGAVVAKYTQTGKSVDFRLKLTFGTTTSISSAPTISLPITAASDESGSIFGTTISTDNASPDNPVPGNLRFASATTLQVFALNTNSVNTLISATNPFTWGTADILEISGTYEAA